MAKKDKKPPLTAEAEKAGAKAAKNQMEFAEDTCDVVVDGKVCGAHIGYGARFLHLRVCDEHADELDEEDDDFVDE